MSDTLGYILLFLLLILLFLSSFFSAAETAYTSVGPAKIAHAAKKSRAGKLIKKQVKSFGWTLATILLGNNLVNVALSTLTSILLIKVIASQSLAAIISIAIVTPIIVIFGELIPKLLAKKHSWSYLKKVAYTMQFFNYLFFPFTYFLSRITLESKITHTESELKSIVNIAHKEKVLQKREATLVKNALDLDSIKVSEVMVFPSNINSIESIATIKQAKNMFKKTGHSRLVVKNGKKYLGIIHIKDIAYLDKGTIIDKIIEVPYISKNIILTKALDTLRIQRSHFAFVSQTVDKKTPIGIITIEDILEELVGEIYDEHDETSPIQEIGLHKFLVLGNVLISDLCEKIEISLDDVEEGMSTFQWLNARLNRHIKKGLTYTYKNKLTFKILANKKGQETEILVIQK